MHPLFHTEAMSGRGDTSAALNRVDAGDELSRRLNAVTTMESTGGARTFSRASVDSAAEFCSTTCEWFVYGLSHRAVPPCTGRGPCLIVCGAFGSQDEARRHALRVHAHTGITVLIGKSHEWMVCCATLERLEDAEYTQATRERVLAREKSTTAIKRTRENIHRFKMQKHEPTVEAWLSTAHMDECFKGPLQEWADTNGFTFHRLGAIEDAEAQEIGVNGPLVRRAYEDWRREVEQVASDDVDPDGVAARAAQDPHLPLEFGSGLQPEEAGPGGPVGTEEQTISPWGTSDREPSPAELRASGSIDSSLHRPDQGFAIVSVVPDEGDQGCSEHLFKLYNVTETQTDADSFIRNVAGDFVHHRDLFVVQMYQWVRLDDRGKATVTHRNDELNRMFESQRSQAQRIRAMEKSIVDGADEDTPAAAALGGGNGGAIEMEEVD